MCFPFNDASIAHFSCVPIGVEMYTTSTLIYPKSHLDKLPNFLQLNCLENSLALSG